MSELRIDTMATEYSVTAADLPRDDINTSDFTITVTYKGHGKWAVMRRRWCLGRNGEWVFEPIPSERNEWLATHRFDLDTALRLAVEEVPRIRANGWTVYDALADVRRRQRSA